MSTIVDWRAKAHQAHQEGNLAAAANAYQNWLIETPDDPDAIHGLGVCAIAEGKNQDAAHYFEHAVELAPKHAAAKRNLGVAYWTLNRRTEARDTLEASNELEPNNQHTLFNLAVAYMGLGLTMEAVAHYRQCLEIDPMHSLAHSNLIFMLDLIADDDAAMDERQKFERRHGPQARAKWQPHKNPKTTNRRLRIGYMSGDYQFHSASFIFRPVLLNHDREHFEVFCYSSTRNHDQTTEWYRDEYRWRSLGSLPPAIINDGIRRDQIDILVDLSGHSKDNQLLTFALKPAPVQVTAWGHALGTGLKAIDYIFSDPYVLPLERRSRFAETVVDLPNVVCYEPQQPAPEVRPLADRPPTFGGFHRMEKISSLTLEMWAAVLKAVPGSRMVIKAPDFDDSQHRTRVLETFPTLGVDPARIELRGKTVHYQHLNQMNDVDVMLDTFPHGGGISTLEALWMGVPVITRQGVNIQSRLAGSFLHAIDLDENVANGLDGFIALARTQVEARPHLTMLRATLRDRLLKSVLCDHGGYTRAVEDHYREFWAKWCAS